MDCSHRSRKTLSLARRLAGVLCAATALVGTAPARAADEPVSADGVQAAVDIAKNFWQAAPCGDQVAIKWMSLPSTTNASSYWANPVDQYTAPEQNTSCEIAFNSALTWDWTRFCSILVHEYGHLSGHAHSTDAADVMYPYYLKPVPECEAAAATQPAVQPAVVAAAASLPDL